MKLLTVVIPTKNEEANIRKCVEALQSDLDWISIIIVDNSSSDKTCDILRSMGQPFLTQGPERSAQRNRGWREAETPFVLFLDADMRLPREVLAEIKGFISSENSPDALYIREERIGDGWWIKVRNFERSFYDGTCIDALRVFKKSLLEKVGGYDETMNAAEDWDLDRRTLETGITTAITKAPLYHDEGNFSWKRHLRKKCYYSKTMDIYRNKWQNDAVVKKQLGIPYRFLGVFTENGKWKRALRHPLMIASIYLERVVVGICYVKISLLGKR